MKVVKKSYPPLKFTFEGGFIDYDVWYKANAQKIINSVNAAFDDILAKWAREDEVNKIVNEVFEL